MIAAWVVTLAAALTFGLAPSWWMAALCITMIAGAWWPQFRPPIYDPQRDGRIGKTIERCSVITAAGALAVAVVWLSIQR